MLLFKPHHKPMILRRPGSPPKTQTRRLWKKPRCRPNAVHRAKLQMMKEDYFAKLRIVDCEHQPFMKMTRADVAAEGYPGMSVSHFMEMFCEMHGLGDEEKAWLWAHGETVDGTRKLYKVEFRVL